jgi:uncharacterized membrane protein
MLQVMDARIPDPRQAASDVTRWLVAAGEGGAKLLPGWLRPHRGEQRWAAMAVVVLAIVLQVLLPDKFVLRPRTAAPSLEGAMVLVLAAMNPGRRLDQRHSVLRNLFIALISVLAVTNAVSTGLLVHFILTGGSTTATKILASGASIWITNVIVYALWYWAWDRGGPVERALAADTKPDFLFPQIADPRLDPDWQPTFVDYLYVSFTNATAFSPTDTMPLSRWAKMLMLAQSAISLVTVGLVAARAVNILPGH